ncbi:MAG: phosphotransferase [Anaerolineae bacterium]
MSDDQAIDLAIAVRVGRLWRLRIADVYPGRIPAGSPDRSLARVVARGEDGHHYVIERLSPADAVRKMEIASLLEALAQVGLFGVIPYLASGSGHHVLPLGADYWQISPYLEGAPLPRPGWVWEAWRGESMAAFLLALRAASLRVRLPAEHPYSLTGLVRDLFDRLRTHRPELAGALAAIVESLLGEWLPPEGSLVTGLCHGDPHPLNVIWAAEGRAIAAVIDWEFCGIKPAAYDAALIIGCVGIEEPEALSGPFVQALLSGLRAGGHPGGAEPALWALVVAIRFAWLSDWLRRGDEEMVGLEEDHIRLLVEQRTELERVWACA